MTARTVVIGLDGATWDLLRPWFEEGHLPNLQQIYEDGFNGTLKSTIPANTSPAVQSLYTGADPATVGLFGFQKPDGSTISLQDVSVPKIWTVLGEHEMSSCIVNVRTTFPPDPLNGVMLSGDPMPGESSEYAYPPELKQSVSGFRCEEKDDRMHKELVPPYEHSEEVLQHAKDIFTHRFDTFQRLASEREDEFLMYWVGETDFLQHRLWKNKDDLLSFYQFMDDRLGAFFESFDGNVILLSDHGFEGPPSTVFHLNEWLLREGYLKTSGGQIGARILGLGQAFGRKFVDKDKLADILYFLQNRGSNSSDSSDEDSGRSQPGINKPHLQIPGISSNSTAQIATNCGIEIVDAENEMAVAKELQSKLLDLTDDAGRKVMKEVVLRDELYEPGPYFEDIPHVLFQAAEHITVKPDFSRSIFHEIPATDRSGRGRHVYARNGVIFGAGPDLKPVQNIDADIVDITPTILHLFGLPIGEQMTGSVLTEICSNEPGTDDVKVRGYADEGGQSLIDDSEQEEMEEWLEDMGYI